MAVMKSHEIAEQLEHISFIDPLAGKRLANKAWVAVEDVEALAKRWRKRGQELWDDVKKQKGTHRLTFEAAAMECLRIADELDALLARAQETTP